jgi:cellobiose phosphorylase
LQGGGTAGGLGLDHEFFESILVPQIMLNDFLGFKPRADGFEIDPKLPKDWKELEITQIHLHNIILDIKVTNDTVIVIAKGELEKPFYIYLPSDEWNVKCVDADGKVIEKIDIRY